MVFLGLLFDRREEQIIAQRSRDGIVQNQANTFQWNCIDGLFSNGIEDLQIVNALPVGVYPTSYREMLLKEKEWEYHSNKHYQIGAINIPVLKQWGRYRSTKRMIKRLQPEEIVIYSPYQPFLKAIQKLDHRHKITLIVPDLPKCYDYSSSSRIRKLLRKYNNRSIDKCLPRIDRFVCLTEQMRDALEIGNRPCMIMEGIYAGAGEGTRRTDSNKKIIFYGGSLSERFGIPILVEAFTYLLNDTYELWICGGGNYKAEIEKAVARDKRIRFFGYVSKEEAMNLQLQATVLVNPRQNMGEYTKYSFPSKMMDYLASGIPLVAYKLDGVPKEYDAFINYVEGNTPLQMAQVLDEILRDTSKKYDDKARLAATFIKEQKSAKAQMEKLLDFINSTM